MEMPETADPEARRAGGFKKRGPGRPGTDFPETPDATENPWACSRTEVATDLKGTDPPTDLDERATPRATGAPPSCYGRLPTPRGAPYPRALIAGGVHEGLASHRHRARRGARGLRAGGEGCGREIRPDRDPLRHRLARRGRARRLLRSPGRGRVRQARPR